ncbi:MAG TPA: hypothetical protein PKA64_16785, partial [Myxococcota bacterium]|nr:hypothetical protein [Myxococcota bacterium]
MRTTEAKPVLDVRLEGEPELAEALARALASAAPVARATHGFHTYPAGLHADAARDLLALFPSGKVLDPFCGGGTVLVEAMLAGRAAAGSDLGPIAALVAWARTRRTDEPTRTRLRSAARALTERARSVRPGDRASLPDDPAARTLIEAWYEPRVAAELAVIREGIAALDLDARARDLLWAAFSSVLIKVSQRRSDTSSGRDDRARPPGTAATFFHKRVREFARQLEELAALAPSAAPEPEVARADARAPGPGGYGLILTSPPYPAVYDYLPLQELREAWLGVRGDRAEEIGARRAWRARDAEAAWRADTEAWMCACARRLDPGGVMAVVIGDGLVGAAPVDALAAT